LIRVRDTSGQSPVFDAKMNIVKHSVSVVVKRIQVSKSKEYQQRRELYLHWHTSSTYKDHFINLIGWYRQDDPLTGDCIYLVMEQADTNLRKYILDRDISTKTQKYLITSIANGVRVLHSLNIAHRDIKPENILILSQNDPLPKLKLCDFGLSREMSDRSKTIISGTESYMAPELLALWNASETKTLASPDLFKADIYALGKLIYFIWMKKDYRPSSEQKHWFQEVLEDKTAIAIMSGCLVTNPKDRWDICRFTKEIDNLIV